RQSLPNLRFEDLHIEPIVALPVETDLAGGCGHEIRTARDAFRLERAAQPPQRGVEAPVRRPILPVLTPEETGQHLARVVAVAVEQQICQQCLDGMGQVRFIWTPIMDYSTASKKVDPQDTHEAPFHPLHGVVSSGSQGKAPTSHVILRLTCTPRSGAYAGR